MVRRVEMSTIKSPPGRKQDAIHFVNARPSSETERRKIQKLVRAHVGKWISDQTKERAAALEVAESSPFTTATTVPSETPSLAPDLESDEPFYHSSPSATSTQLATSAESPERLSCISFAIQASPQRTPSQQQDEPQPMALVTVTPLPEAHIHHCENDDCECSWSSYSSSASSPRSSKGEIESFGASFLDPFRTYPSKFSQDDIQISEAYCLSTLWPGLTPSPTGENTSPSSQWFPISLQDPTLFTAFLFGSLSHRRVQWLRGWTSSDSFQLRDQRLLERCEMDTIEMVSREMNNPSRAVCDAIILSVVCMAHNKADGTVWKNQDIPFDSPMQRLQWLDIYGSLPPNLVHLKGLVQMVTLRGGIFNIKLPGLGQIISLSDIITASTFFTNPVFPFVALVESRHDMTLQELLGFTDADVDRLFNHLRPLGLPQSMLDVFCAARAYSYFIDQPFQTRNLLDYCLLADQRNKIQHVNLNFPSASQLDGFSSYGPYEIIYEACRLAMLIFGAGVILPLPGQNSPLPRLGSFLRTTLELPHPSDMWDSPAARIVYIWVLMLGGIVSEKFEDRAWYAGMLYQAVVDNEIKTWDELHTIIRMMPWSQVACERAGIKLWCEMKQQFMETNEDDPTI